MRDHTGCGTIRMYGLGSFQSPTSSRASLCGTEPAIITFSPCVQSTGVGEDQLDLLVRPDDEHFADGLVVRGRAALGVP